MKDWIDKRLVEIKSDNVIILNNWREYYNRIDRNIQSRNKLTKVFNAIHKELKEEMGEGLVSQTPRGQNQDRS